MNQWCFAFSKNTNDFSINNYHPFNNTLNKLTDIWAFKHQSYNYNTIQLQQVCCHTHEPAGQFSLHTLCMHLIQGSWDAVFTQWCGSQKGQRGQTQRVWWNMQYKEICSLIIIKKVSMAAILESLECNSCTDGQEGNQCNTKQVWAKSKWQKKLARRQADPEYNAAMDRKPLSDVTAALPGYLS